MHAYIHMENEHVRPIRYAKSNVIAMWESENEHEEYLFAFSMQSFKWNATTKMAQELKQLIWIVCTPSNALQTLGIREWIRSI